MKAYTKDEILDLVKKELIKTFGGLSTDSNGKRINFPYSVIGVIHAAIPDSCCDFCGNQITGNRIKVISLGTEQVHCGKCEIE